MNPRPPGFERYDRRADVPSGEPPTAVEGDTLRRFAVGTDPPQPSPEPTVCESPRARRASVDIAFDEEPAGSVAAPASFGKYQVTRRLATGGMAEVYLARVSGIEGFEKLVVIKRLKPELARSATATRLFLQEARIAATLVHPQIAQVYDAGVVDDSYYLAMEYVEGHDLRHLMNVAKRRRRPLRLEEALRVVTEVCGALHFAHEKRGPDGDPLGLVHRDVSPSNVLISHDGAVKLCDFGVAEVAASRRDPGRRTIAGKLSYMSPEQCRGDLLDRRSDVFVLSVVLYELTTLRKLFKGRSDREVVEQVIEGRIAPPSTVVAGYAAELERIVMKGLAMDPADRYATALEMRLDLEAFAREHKLAVTAVGLSDLMHLLFVNDEPDWEDISCEAASDFDPPSIEVRSPRPYFRAWLAAAVVAGAAALATLPVVAARRGDAERLAQAVRASGERIAGKLELQLGSVRSRAASLATAPMLRAAISTDPRTVQDMVSREALLAPGPGEVIELLQWRGRRSMSLVRMPPGAGPGAPMRGGEARVRAEGGSLLMTASARLEPLYTERGLEGALVLSSPADPDHLARELPAGVARATIRGLEREVPLVAGDGRPSSAPLLVVPMRLEGASGLPALELAAALPPADLSGPSRLRNLALALTVAFLGLYVHGRRRFRWWSRRS